MSDDVADLVEMALNDKGPWRLLSGAEAASRVAIAAEDEDSIQSAAEHTAKLHAEFLEGRMFAATSLSGNIFLGNHAETQQFVNDHGGWVRPTSVS